MHISSGPKRVSIPNKAELSSSSQVAGSHGSRSIASAMLKKWYSCGWTTYVPDHINKPATSCIYQHYSPSVLMNDPYLDCLVMSSEESSPIVNPVVYLNYLSPGIASEFELNRNVTLATLGALIWDILSSIPEDYRLIRTGKLTVILCAYLVARPMILITVTLTVLQKTGPISNCGLVAMILVAFQVISSAASSYLFLKRAHAVYFKCKMVKHIFTFLWLVGFGTSCAAFSGPLQNSIEIANTKHCIRVQDMGPMSIAFMDPVIFDTLVYIAIMYKILATHQTGAGGWKTLCYWTALPHVSRAVLQGGQQYYLITTAINIPRFIMTLTPTLSPSLQVILASPAVTLTSVMACRVHRNLIIKGLEEAADGVLTTLRFADAQVVTITLPRDAESQATESNGQCISRTSR